MNNPTTKELVDRIKKAVSLFPLINKNYQITPSALEPPILMDVHITQLHF